MRANRTSQALALAALLLVGCGGGDDAEQPGPEAGLSAAQLAGQRFLFPFDGVEPPRELVRRIGRGEAAGVILFARNYRSHAQLRRAIGRLQRVRRPAGLRAPLIVAVDQEGGQVNRIPGAPRRSAAERGTAGPAEAGRGGRAAARTLRDVGANVDLAPVVDVVRPGSALEREQRGFGPDPRDVAATAGAFAEGLRDGGVAATAKHFPGFGAAPVNTDRAPVRIRLSRSVLEDIDLLPFRELSDNVDLVMLSTAVYPALDDRPAALSRPIATGLLRDDIGFGGVSVTDDLQAPSAAAWGETEELALSAARAGNDLLLFAKDFSVAAAAADGLERAIHRGSLRREEAEEAAGRVLALRGRLPG